MPHTTTTATAVRNATGLPDQVAVAFAILAKKVDAFLWPPLEKTPIGKVARIVTPVCVRRNPPAQRRAAAAVPHKHREWAGPMRPITPQRVDGNPPSLAISAVAASQWTLSRPSGQCSSSQIW